MKKIAFAVVVVYVCIMFLRTCKHVGTSISKYTIPNKRTYAAESWAVVSGASRGQGRQFALQLSKQGVHLLLLGSKRTLSVQHEIQTLYPDVHVRVVVVDFRNSHSADFFDPIRDALENLPGPLSLLVNNVGHRFGFIPYHEMPHDKIRDVIAVGTYPQTILTSMCLPYLLQTRQQSTRGDICGIIFITAQTSHPKFFLDNLMPSNSIYLPYLSVYEGSNVFGHYHAQSIYHEYKNSGLDILVVTPGAVLTESTDMFLNNVPGHVQCDAFVQNILRMYGRLDGVQNAHWKHDMLPILINFAPFMKHRILERTGYKIASHYKSTFVSS